MLLHIVCDIARGKVIKTSDMDFVGCHIVLTSLVSVECRILIALCLRDGESWLINTL